jgi:hypothetical protein
MWWRAEVATALIQRRGQEEGDDIGVLGPAIYGS